MTDDARRERAWEDYKKGMGVSYYGPEYWYPFCAGYAAGAAETRKDDKDMVTTTANGGVVVDAEKLLHHPEVMATYARLEKRIEADARRPLVEALRERARKIADSYFGCSDDSPEDNARQARKAICAAYAAGVEDTLRKLEEEKEKK